ncbi:hypothetical protein ACFPM7_05260 [Actinokineospora guangxiensis]|uniref:Uncharacterized protein n=1 Tax=Actinokineospora guangxiensis TaxID=1490288 RepID=A0ABW0EGE1_9PSEU
MRRSRGRPPHEVVSTAPAPLLVPALVRNLAEVVRGDIVYCVPTPAGLVAVAAWPPRPRPQALAADVAAAAADPRFAVVEAVPGGGAVLVAKSGRVSPSELAAVGDTAVWLGVAARVERDRAARDRAAARTDAVTAELRTARARLAQVRDLERRRLVAAVTAVTGREFGDVRARAGDLRADLDPAAAERLRDALDDLIDTFRTTVRGVHPAMLPDRGPAAALEELAATLATPVRFAGDLGRRVGWEVESGLYHAVAAVLNLVAARGGPPVTVALSRADGALQVRVTASARADLGDALADDAERIAVLGGALDCAVEDAYADVVTSRMVGTDDASAQEFPVTVTVRLPERLGAPPEQPEGTSLLDAVRGVLEHGWQTAPDQRVRDRWAAIAERLHHPPRLAVLGGHRAVSALLGIDVPPAEQPTWYVHGEGDATTDPAGNPVVRLPAEPLRSLSIVDLTTPLDAALAAALPVDPVWAVDAVVCPSPPAPWLRAALRSAEHRVMVLEAAAPHTVPGRGALREAVARGLLLRADTVAARRALVDAAALVRALRDGHSLAWSVERVRACAHDLAELDLMDDIDRGAVLLRDRHGEALRLLGVHGLDARSRLDLPSGASDARVRSAARDAADRWRAAGAHPAATGSVRAAAEVLVRTCEGIAAR